LFGEDVESQPFDHGLDAAYEWMHVHDDLFEALHDNEVQRDPAPDHTTLDDAATASHEQGHEREDPDMSTGLVDLLEVFNATSHRNLCSEKGRQDLDKLEELIRLGYREKVSRVNLIFPSTVLHSTYTIRHTSTPSSRQTSICTPCRPPRYLRRSN
jgi:hypothetical protein